MSSNNQWRKRRSVRIPPLLSDRDELVPETHIPLFSLVTNPKDPAIYMSPAQCQRLRRQTYDAVAAIYKKCRAPDFQEFWNYSLEDINESGLNQFARHPKLAPVLGIMECFEKQMHLKSNRSLRYIISFGFNKEKLAAYLSNVKRAQETGEGVPLPRLDLRPRKTRDLIFFGETRINVDGGSVKTDKNAVYRRFADWCRLSGVTEKNGATMALNFFMDNHPIKGLKDLPNYDIITEIDRGVLAAKKPSTWSDEAVKVNLDGTVLAKARHIIKQYNRDIDNLDKENLTIESYINNALHVMNQNMPLKYRDRHLYEQRRQLELLEQQAEAWEDEEDDDGWSDDDG